MNLTTTRERGNFYCPTCALTQPYRLRARRPWLTLYFIPTVPVGPAELFVQCDQCRSTWDPTVLEMDQQSHEMAQEAQFRDEALRASVLVVIADDQITEAEINALQLVGNQLLERPVDREELGQLCSIAQQNEIEAANYVLTVCRRWTQKQRSVALQAMFLTATADEMGDEQTTLLAKMREILEFTDDEYHQAIEEALAWETA
ncbi:MAG: TerB family tellurite resistance protein [Planctomycetota bacterium]